MSTPDTNNIGIKLQSAGENLNTWGDPNLNNDFVVVSNIGSKWNALTINGDTTISETNYATTNDTEVATIDLVAGTVTAVFSLTFPSRDKRILLRNSTGYLATCKLSATTGFTLPTGRTVMFATDGASDAYNLTPNYGGFSVGANASDILNMGGVQALITAASTGISGGFASNFFYTATGGETSKSGADDYGATLAYTPGTQTEVFLNGVKLVPSVDYVASTGTSITGLSALAASDILSVRAWATFAASSTYTQAQVNALFASPPIGVGSSVPTTGAFTTLTASGTVSGAGFTARFASPGAIGSTAASTGAFTTLSASGQFTSTVTTGSSPFVVASTTVVSNLNAALLNGTTWTAPGAIGGGTPAAGSFTTGAFSSSVTGGTSYVTAAVAAVASGLRPGNSDTVPFSYSINASGDLATCTFGWQWLNRSTDGDLRLQRYVSSNTPTDVMNIARASGNITHSSGSFTFGGAAITKGYTVGTLPTGVQGARVFVTDSNAASFTAGIGAIVAAGASTVVPVFYDGTNWRIG